MDFIMFDKTKEGLTLWVDGRWIIDASLFKENRYFSIDTDRLEILTRNPLKKLAYWILTREKYGKIRLGLRGFLR